MTSNPPSNFANAGQARVLFVRLPLENLSISEFSIDNGPTQSRLGWTEGKDE